jgi:endonuclease/exonuclease/phosphatase family metal-dependent hydrolase
MLIRLFISSFVFVSTTALSQELHVMSFNIRLNTSADSLNAWPYRKDKVATQVLFHQAQLLGVQEALHDQMKDLKERLPRFNYVGVARDDGKEKGEYSAIFYDSTRLKVVRSGTFWLSKTPDVPGSKSWDAAITRIVSWAEFIELINRKRFVVFNTHFDHIGKEARKESATLLLNKVAEIAGPLPVIVMGDFNAKPSDEPIKVLVDTLNPLHVIDTKDISFTPHYGPTGTFNAFRNKEVDDQPIDFIFIKGKWRVIKHATISQTWDGRFASDHFAVFASLILVER